MPSDNDSAGETMTFSSARQILGAIRRQELTEGDPAPLEGSGSKESNPDDVGTPVTSTTHPVPESGKAGITSCRLDGPLGGTVVPGGCCSPEPFGGRVAVPFRCARPDNRGQGRRTGLDARD